MKIMDNLSGPLQDHSAEDHLVRFFLEDTPSSVLRNRALLKAIVWTRISGLSQWIWEVVFERLLR